MTTNSQPLSLEDQCLLHLICHLEDFPTEALASLSIPVRRRLLMNLPAVDVCQLEGTAVTEGINMEMSVWKELYRERTEVRQEERSSFKQLYFDRVYEYLFNGYLDDDGRRAGRLLFSICACLGVSNWSDIQHSFASVEHDSPTPHRHATEFTGERLMAHIIAAMIQKCKCWPENIDIDCDYFLETNSWDRTGFVFSNLKTLLGKVKSARFFEEGWDPDPIASSIPQYFLEAVFARHQVSLKAFSLNGSYDFIGVALASGRLFFSSTHSEEQYLQQSFYSRALPSVPYSELSSIDIAQEVEDWKDDERVSLHKDLESIIAYQTSLTSVSLDNFNPCTPTCSSLIRSLGSLFHQPQFLELKLGWIALGMKELRLLIHDFMASPMSQDYTKTFFIDIYTLARVNITPPETPNYNAALGPPADRALSLSLTDSESGELFWWLLQYPCSRLRSFSFTAFYEEIVECSVMTLFAGPAQILLERIELQHTSLLHNPSPELPFRNIFCSPFLKAVSLCDCRIGQAKLLPALTQGLREQIPMGELEELCLDRNQLGDCDADDFEAFCDTLFKLGTVPKLVLSIQRNGLKPMHFVTMYTTWKRNFSCVNKRMKQLLVSGNKYEQHLAELQDIASSLMTDFVYSEQMHGRH